MKTIEIKGKHHALKCNCSEMQGKEGSSNWLTEIQSKNRIAITTEHTCDICHLFIWYTVKKGE